MKLKDNIKVAFGSINDNKLRTVLTALIIAIGIMALVGILTSIDGMKKSINDNFASMGANSYSIRNRGSGSIRLGGGRAKQKDSTILLLIKQPILNANLNFLQQFRFLLLPLLRQQQNTIPTKLIQIFL